MYSAEDLDKPDTTLEPSNTARITHMPAITILTVIESILGEDSRIYRLVSEPTHANDASLASATSAGGTANRPSEIELCKRFANLKIVMEKVCATAVERIRVHLTSPSICLEKKRWIREVASQNYRTTYTEKVVTICIVLRDFDDIQSQVIAACLQQLAAAAQRDTGTTKLMLETPEVMQQTIKNSKKESKHKSLQLQKKVRVLMATFPDKYAKYTHMSEGQQSNDPEACVTCVSAAGPAGLFWMQELERTESESKLVACAEIMRNQYDKKKTFSQMALYCQARAAAWRDGNDAQLLCCDADDIEQWYEHHWQRGGGPLNNVMITCMLFAYKTSPRCQDYMQIQGSTAVASRLPASHALVQAHTPISMRELEMVVWYCATLIQKVDNAVLCHLLPIDIHKFKMVEETYDKLRSSTQHLQEAVLATVHDISLLCKQLYQSCMQIEMCLRMFVYTRMQQDVDTMHELRGFLRSYGACSVQDNLEQRLQEWTVAPELELGNCKMTLSLMTWGADNFVIFCMQSDVILSSLPASYITIQEDGVVKHPCEYFANIDYGERVDLMLSPPMSPSKIYMPSLASE